MRTLCIQDSSSESFTQVLIENQILLPPAYVLMEQKCSLFNSDFKENPAVIFLYKVAKEALDHYIKDHESTVNTLLDISTETDKQFKRVLEAANESEAGLNKARSIANELICTTIK